MKISWIKRILLAITFASSVSTIALVSWKITQENNLKVESKSNSVREVELSRDDLAKVLTYRNNSYVFDLPKLEYFLIHKTLNIYPQYTNSRFSFKTDSYLRSRNVEMTISGQQEISWVYSII